MHVLIVSGFLGAGKTTFIRELVEQTGEDFAILENEYGDLGVDGAILEEAAAHEGQQVEVWEMLEGCICCSVKADFALSVLTIANALDPHFLIVEPTGVGMLSNIVRTISKIEYDRIGLLQPITVIDANCFEADRVEYGAIYEDQVKHSGRIVLSKTERIDGARVAAIVDELKAMNPHAVIEADHYSGKPKAWWDALLREGAGGGSVDAEEADAAAPDLDTVGFSDVRMEGIGALTRLLEMTVRSRFGSVKRAKGVIAIGDACVRFNVVSALYTIEEAPTGSACDVVFIGKDLDTEGLASLLSPSRPEKGI